MNAWTRLWRRPSAPEAGGWRSTYRTHVGRIRLVNEDRVLDRPDRALWAVADGMGGHLAGDRAAQAAVDALGRIADGPAPITADAILRALRDADDAIAGENVAGRSGTTIVVAWGQGARLHLFWAGDSRAYLLRRGEALPLTRDHSIVQELVDAGVLTEAAAARHPQANVITRALGIGAGVSIDREAVELEPGDAVLLCSDGLSRSLDPRDFVAGAGPDELADRLLMNALRRDGSDNASLVLLTPEA